MTKHKASLWRIVLIIYTLIICIAGTLVIRANFQNRWDAHLQNIEKVLNDLAQQYEDITGEFWRYYLPLVSSSESTNTLDNYFSVASDSELPPIQRQQLIDQLLKFTSYFEDVQWIALSAECRSINYVFRLDGSTGRLNVLDDDFPFQSAFVSDSAFMQVVGSQLWSDQEYFAIVGGSVTRNPQNRIMFGFPLSMLDNAVARSSNSFSTLGFYIVENDQLIYSSTRKNETPYLASHREITTVQYDDQRILVFPAADSPRQSICYFTIHYHELFWQVCSEVYHSLIVLLIMLLLSLSLLLLFNYFLNREVSAIRRGLKCIGNNHLDFRFTLHFRNDGFNDIALAVNSMAEELQHSLERSRQLEQKQRENEMAELIAKYDPHFLYNTLELFRSRCLRNGDEDTANLISHAAKLFRGLINSKQIVTVQEELAFNEHYLHLFRSRFGEHTRILYDFDSEVMQCEIIHNILQPLIENYFEHGIDVSRSDNILQICGKKTGDHEICLTVQDNGYGISDDDLLHLRAQLNESRQQGSSYGLRNLHQRIRLYYGDSYGLHLDHGNNHTGLRVSILLPVNPSPSSSCFSPSDNTGVQKAITYASDHIGVLSEKPKRRHHTHSNKKRHKTSL